MEAKVHKTQFSFHTSRIFPFLFLFFFPLFPAASLSRLKQLSYSNTALRCIIYFPAFEILSTMKHFMKRFRQRFTFSSPKRIFTHVPTCLHPTHSLHMQISQSRFGSKFPGSAPHPRSCRPRVAPSTSDWIQPISANVSFSEQIQAFALVLTDCAINNSQQMWSNPTKTVEWTISSKHGRGLLGVSECWCIPAELVSWPMNQWVSRQCSKIITVELFSLR